MIEPADDNLILTHRYLAGELSGSELVGFEERLQSDATLQETLVDLVLIQGSLELIGEHDQVGSAIGALRLPSLEIRNRQRRRSRWLLAASVAGVALLSSYFWQSRQKEASPWERQTVAVWSELADVASQESADIVVNEHHEHFEQDSSESALEVPDWMFAAVDALDAEMSSDAPASLREGTL